MTQLQTISPFERGAVAFKNFIVTEITLSPIAVIALVIIFPAGILAVCKWGTRKAYIAIESKKTEKANAIALAQLEKQKENLWFGAKIVGAGLIVGGISILAYDYFSVAETPFIPSGPEVIPIPEDVIKQASEFTTNFIESLNRSLPVLTSNATEIMSGVANVPRQTMNNVNEIVNHLTQHFQRPAVSDSTPQISNMISNITSESGNSTIDKIERLAVPFSDFLQCPAFNDIPAKVQQIAVAINHITTNTTKTTTSLFSRIDMYGVGASLLSYTMSAGSLLYNFSGSALSTLGTAASTTASVATTTYNALYTAATYLDLVVQVCLKPINLVIQVCLKPINLAVKVISFKPIKWGVCIWVLANRNRFNERIYFMDRLSPIITSTLQKPFVVAAISKTSELAETIFSKIMQHPAVNDAKNLVVEFFADLLDQDDANPLPV